MAPVRSFGIRLSLVEAGISILFFIIMLVIIAGFLPVHHPWLTSKMTGLLLDAGAGSCSIGSVKVIAWRSIVLQDVVIAERLDADHDYVVGVANVNISANLVQLLINRKKIQQILFSDEPDIFRSVYLKPAITAGKMLLSRNNLPWIKKADFSDVRYAVKFQKRELTGGVNGTVTLTQSREKFKNSEIEVSFPFLKIYGDGFENMKCIISCSPDGRLFLQDFTAKYYDGKIKMRATINFQENLIDSYSVNIEKLDLAYWYTVHIGIGKVAGRTSLHLEGTSVPLRSPLRSAGLQITISPCSITDLPIQQSLATSLFIPSLSTVEFSKITIRAAFDTADTVKASLAGSGDQLNFTTSGWIKADGALQQHIEGTFSRKMISEFPPVVKKTLEPTKDGGYSFRCRLYGTFTDPRFELDKETLQRAVGNMFENISRELMQQNNKR